MKLSMQLDYDGSVEHCIGQVVEFERAGLDIVWVAEAYGHTAPSFMGYLAARTEQVQIGAGILPIFTRTPTLLAQTAASVDFLSGGRCILGLGASGPQVIEGWHGVPFDRPLTRLRETVDICRMVWRRESLSYDGRCYTLPLPPDEGTGLGKSLTLINRPVRNRIPIYIAALGDKSVELTAEVADGWLPLLFLPERAADVWGPALTAGRARRSGDLGALEVRAGGIVAVVEESAAGPIRDTVRPAMALYLGGMGARGRNFYNDVARRSGFEREAAQIQDLYLAGHKEEAAAKVPDSLLESMAIVGPESYVRDRIAAYKAAGVTILDVTPFGPDPVGLMGRIKEWAS